MLSTKLQKYQEELLRKGRAQGQTEGRIEGRVEGLLESHRRLVKVLLESKFGDDGRSLWPHVDAEGDVERLETLVKFVGLGHDLGTVRAEVWP